MSPVLVVLGPLEPHLHQVLVQRGALAAQPRPESSSLPVARDGALAVGLFGPRVDDALCGHIRAEPLGRLAFLVRPLPPRPDRSRHRLRRLLVPLLRAPCPVLGAQATGPALAGVPLPEQARMDAELGGDVLGRLVVLHAVLLRLLPELEAHQRPVALGGRDLPTSSARAQGDAWALGARRRADDGRAAPHRPPAAALSPRGPAAARCARPPTATATPPTPGGSWTPSTVSLPLLPLTTIRILHDGLALSAGSPGSPRMPGHPGHTGAPSAGWGGGADGRLSSKSALTNFWPG